VSSKVTGTGRDRRQLSRISVTSALVVFALVAGMLPAFAASISSAVFNGGTGTALVNGTFFAKSGAALTLTVNTGNNARCVQLSGAHQAIQTSPTAKTVWTFNLQAAAGGGVQTVNISPTRPDGTGRTSLSTGAPQTAAPGFRARSHQPTTRSQPTRRGRASRLLLRIGWETTVWGRSS
jgi:hypothetical protein